MAPQAQPPPDPPPAPRAVVRKPQLRPEDRIRLLSQLMHLADRWTLPWGARERLAHDFGVHRTTVSRLWKRACQSFLENPDEPLNVDSRKKRQCGRKKVFDRQNLVHAAKTSNLLLRQSMSALAGRIGCSKATVYRLIKDEKIFRPHSSTLKPTIDEENKLSRLFFVSEQIDPITNKFMDQYNRVHVDEKWFFLTKKNARYYLAHDEATPHRHIRSKNHITKVMFLCAVARPRGNFDGKLGIWPFAVLTPAACSSRNRPRGALEWKGYNVDKDAYKRMIIDKVVPAIKERWPAKSRNLPIKIQHDNAKPHLGLGEDPEFVAAATENGWNISIYAQPPNSPDTNVLDLGFFNGIQALQHTMPSSNTGDLIAAVQTAFQNYEPQKLNNSFLTMFQCFNKIAIHNGNINYAIPHMGKATLINNGELPVTIDVAHEAAEWLDLAEEFGDGQELENQEMI